MPELLADVALAVLPSMGIAYALTMLLIVCAVGLDLIVVAGVLWLCAGTRTRQFPRNESRLV